MSECSDPVTGFLISNLLMTLKLQIWLHTLDQITKTHVFMKKLIG